MSVAFRRETDEEHLEPKFERPIPPGPNWVTRTGLVALEREVARLDRMIADAGDEAREALERDRRYWRYRLSTAEIATPPVPGEVGIGSHVRLRLGGAERAVTIVGADEADGRASIAFTAPLARALMGAMAGEAVAFGGRADAIEILAVGEPS